MTNQLQIKLTPRGVEVTVAGRTTSFGHIDQAVGFAHDRLRRAIELRDLSERCE